MAFFTSMNVIRNVVYGRHAVSLGTPGSRVSAGPIQSGAWTASGNQNLGMESLWWVRKKYRARARTSSGRSRNSW